MRWLGSGIALFALLGACLPMRRQPTPASKPAPVDLVPDTPRAPLPDLCIPSEVSLELTCRIGDERVVPANVVWPKGDALYHYPPRKIWVSPVLPRAVTDEVAKRLDGEPKLKIAETALLEATERAGALEEENAKKRAAVLEPLWKKARDAYAAYLKELPDPSPLRAYATSRLARMRQNLGQFDEALGAAASVLDLVKKNPSSVGAAPLAERALVDVGRFYARSKLDPARAKDIAVSNEGLESIAEGYFELGRYDDAMKIFGDLVARTKASPRSCVYGARSLSVALASRYQHPRVLELAQDQLKQLKVWPDDPECRAATFAIVNEIANAYHVDAVGWRNGRGSGDLKEMRASEQLYHLLDEGLPPEDLELPSASLPWLAEEQRPTSFRLRFARAELARFQKDWARCGPLFGEAAEAAPDPASRAAAVTNAVGCHAEAAAEQRKLPASNVIGKQEEQLVSSSRQFLCGVAGDHADVALARGIVFYRSRQWDRAVASLEELAFTAGRRQAREAASYYLVSLFRLRESTGRADCNQQLERDKAKLVALHCSGGDDDPASGPSVVGVTVSEGSRPVSPCEAMRALGAPPPPLPQSQRKLVGVGGHDVAIVSGSVVPEVVGWAIRTHASQLSACYDLALARNPYVSANEQFSFTIARDGSVGKVVVSNVAQHKDPDLDACVVRVVNSMSFAPPEGGVAQVLWHASLSRTRGVQLVGAPIVKQDR